MSSTHQLKYMKQLTLLLLFIHLTIVARKIMQIAHTQKLNIKAWKSICQININWKLVAITFIIINKVDFE